MDKVDFTAASLLNSTISPGLKPEVKRAKTRGEETSIRKTRFSEILDSFTPIEDIGPARDLAPSEEALTELMDAVHSAGSDLLDRPFHDEILRYKKAVRDFIHYVIENGYELYKIQGIKKKSVIRGETEWKTKIYLQLHVVDQKLEELAAAILSGQATQLERVSKLNEITGLLVDLTISGAIRERDD